MTDDIRTVTRDQLVRIGTKPRGMVTLMWPEGVCLSCDNIVNADTGEGHDIAADERTHERQRSIFHPAAGPAPTTDGVPRTALEDDLHRRLHEPGPLVTITKAQAAWLLERHSAFAAILQAADDRIAAVEAAQPAPGLDAIGAVLDSLTVADGDAYLIGPLTVAALLAEAKAEYARLRGGER